MLIPGHYAWSYLIVGLGVMAENAGVPLPGETIMITASILSAAGRLDPVMIMVSGASGAVIGDNIGYWVGRIGGRKLFLGLAGRFAYMDRAMKTTERFFGKFGGTTVFFARFIAGVRIFAGPFAGLSLMGFKRFFFFNALGAVVWACALVLGIRYAGSVYTRYIQGYEDANYIIYGLLSVILLFITVRLIKNVRKP